MTFLNNLWSHVSISAIVQIFILYLVIYSILKAVKGSRVGQVLMGVGILAAAAAAFTFLFQFDVLSVIVQSLLAYLAISTVVIFQPEIRRILGQVGAFGYLEKSNHTADGAATPEFIAETILALSARRMGALLGLERGISLRSYEATGITTDAVFSRELLVSIFTPPLPLHDGGVVLRDGRIAAAHCVFPVSNSSELLSHGLRHRAATGLSEETDAIAIVVSEETGLVSVAHNGKLTPCTGPEAKTMLVRWIGKAMPGATRRRNRILDKATEQLAKLFHK